MACLTIGWQYLTGNAVATDPADRGHAEWPPHPARVFMALAGAWFETDEDAEEGAALRWLETLNEPLLRLPPNEEIAQRDRVTCYVPVNDKVGPSAAALQSVPAMNRSKQPRTFLTVHLGDIPCFMHWPDVDAPSQILDALDRLCQKVTRIGHSSSLVRMWASDQPPQDGRTRQYAVEVGVQAAFRVRRLSSGFLDTLIDNYGAGPRREKEELHDQIQQLKARRKAIKGKGARERKAELDEHLQTLREQDDALQAASPVRPHVGLWSGYRPVHDAATDTAKSGNFDPELLILKRAAGPVLPSVSTLALTQALRGTILKHAPGNALPDWITGHRPDGRPLDTADGHLALIPLPFVGHAHADGHLLGLALAFPHHVDRRERGRNLGPMLIDANTGNPRQVKLQLGRLGTWTLSKSDYREQREALQAASWTAAPSGATTWASVTPVVLDRFPKTDRQQDKRAWREEVATIIVNACQRSGLPQPQAVDIDTSSWQLGSPRAIGKRRRLRSSAPGKGVQDAALGDGFPHYPAKGTNAPRVQVHVWLRFAEPLVGPVLLGAGRFRGYGLLKPCREFPND